MPLSKDEAKLKLLTSSADLYADVLRAFTREPDYPRTIANERERYGSALIAIAQFFSGLGDRRLGDRFFELASAIVDLNTGTLHPLLRPAHTENRRADPSQLWRARVRVVLAFEALVRSGVARKDAAAQVARKVSVAELAGVNAKSERHPGTGW
jgi:hypothetical protein